MMRTRCKCGCEHIIESDKPELFIKSKVCFKCGNPVQFRIVEVEEQVEEKVESKKPLKKKVLKRKKK